MDRVDRERRYSRETMRDVRRVERLPLPQALRFLLYLSDRWSASYERAALRFIVRVIDEVEPPIFEVKRLADALAHLRHGHFGPYAREGLKRAMRQLERREERLSVEFTSRAE
jgi:hypothetical protein